MNRLIRSLAPAALGLAALAPGLAAQNGGAHPGGMERVTERFGVWVPSGRAINPITGTNWEGTGVQPGVEVPAADALRTAHLAALRAVLAGATTPEHRAALEPAIAEAERGG